MLDLRRLRLLRELHARGTIAAVADALRYTPSAVSQQLAVLEREAGQPLFERAGRGVRLTDAALVLVGHAEALLDRAELAEAELAAAAGAPAGRGRIGAFQSAAHHLAAPAVAALAVSAPALRCELVEAEPEWALPALERGDFDLVIADEWDTQPLARPPALERHDLLRDEVRVILPADHPLAADGGPGPDRRPARRAVGDRPRPHGLERPLRPHLPPLRRASTPTSATAPTTAASASPWSPTASPSASSPSSSARGRSRASPSARSPTATSTAPSSPPPAPATPRRPSVQALLAAVQAPGRCTESALIATVAAACRPLVGRDQTRARSRASVVLLLIVSIAGAAKGKPVKTVKVTVAIENASGSVVRDWSLGVGLAPGTRLVRAKGMKASGKTKAITLTPKVGARPRRRRHAHRCASSSAARRCRAPTRSAGATCTSGPKQRAGRTLKVRVTCRLKAPGPTEPQPSPTPAGPGATAEPSPDPGSRRAEPQSVPVGRPRPRRPPPTRRRTPSRPYVDMTLGAPSDAPDIAAARAATGAGATTLGFITALGNTLPGRLGRARRHGHRHGVRHSPSRPA